MKELTAEEKLRKILNEINEAKSNYISVNKLIDIIGIKTPSYKNITNPYESREENREFLSSDNYIENYIS